MKLIIVAAHDPNLVIGKDGTLPWYYPEDLKFFKKTTIGSPVLMGRGVFEELNEKPLPGRRNIVLSRTRTYSGTESFPSIQEALEALSGEEVVYIIGGAEIYRELIGQADEVVNTENAQEAGGATFFADDPEAS